jgi:hypothetical protein
VAGVPLDGAVPPAEGRVGWGAGAVTGAGATPPVSSPNVP